MGILSITSHIFHTTKLRWCNKSLLQTHALPVVLCLSLVACAALNRPKQSKSQTISRVFKGSYDDIWGATLKVLDSFNYEYPTAQKDSGYIETKFKFSESTEEHDIAGGQKFPKEIKWKLRIWLLASEKSPERIRVRIEKMTYIRGQFLSAWEHRESNSIIEKKLFYRIARVKYLDTMVERLTTPMTPPQE